MTVREQIELPRVIGSSDWPDTDLVANPFSQYDHKIRPRVTRENLEFLAEKYNELIRHLETEDD